MSGHAYSTLQEMAHTAVERGLLVRSGESLQRFAKINVIVFDKTGTLTYGTPRVSSIVSVRNDVTKKYILQMCAAEQHSELPLGKAIVEAYGIVVDDCEAEGDDR